MSDNLLMLNVHSSKGNKTLKSHEGPNVFLEPLQENDVFNSN